MSTEYMFCTEYKILQIFKFMLQLYNTPNKSVIHTYLIENYGDRLLNKINIDDFNKIHFDTLSIDNAPGEIYYTTDKKLIQIIKELEKNKIDKNMHEYLFLTIDNKYRNYIEFTSIFNSSNSIIHLNLIIDYAKLYKDFGHHFTPNELYMMTIM